ncbi:hypothetical protein D0Z70_20035 [Sphingobium terrigena]|uniref:Uncharacterized protein n=1 Tax=Sphingobium terrigena TaxID=2304063 RepID=A0A418YMU6_9SPHN|nr:hypothetical protein [Sphingobium terrigena]RJG52499.1 hypothetical protein D0Z70_20035 [Sphingobium terrigena]
MTPFEFIRNTKVQIVALTGAVSTLATFVFAMISTREGIKTGENIGIVWSMFWPYVLIAVCFAAVAANAPLFVRKLQGAWRWLGVRRSAATLGLSPACAWLFNSLVVAVAFTLAGVSAAIVVNLFNIARTETNYLLRLANQDFKNRQMVLARQYMEGFQLHDAARVYAYVHKQYADDQSRSRLDEIEQRYRLYQLFLALARDEERLWGATPNNSYRKATTLLLSPFEPDSAIPLERYQQGYVAALDAFKRLKGPCGWPIIDPTQSQRMVPDAKLLLEKDMQQLIWREKRNPAAELCGIIKSGGLSEETIAKQWQAQDLRRLLALRKSGESQAIVCPANVVEEEKAARKPENEDMELEAAGDDAVVEDEVAGSEKDDQPPETLSPYARAQYTCQKSSTDDPGSFPNWKKVIRIFMPRGIDTSDETDETV